MLRRLHQLPALDGAELHQKPGQEPPVALLAVDAVVDGYDAQPREERLPRRLVALQLESSSGSWEGT